jgi:hypothetical protein
MKCNVFGILAIVTLSLLISVPIMSAQAIATASVPFAFTVENTEMSAGSYVITSVSDSAIAVINRSKGTVVISLFHSEQPENNDDTTKLVFHRYGDTYFLSQVARGSGETVIQLPISKQESEAQIQNARSGSAREVVIAAK